MKKLFWNALGFLSLGMAYIGLITPGIPYSPFIVFSAYCFSKGSERMHRWIYNHKLFGPFLTGWSDKRIFPTKFKYFMVVTMCTSLTIMWFTTGNLNAIYWTGAFMAMVVVWGWRYPGSEAVYQQRKAAGKRIAWLK